MKNKYFTILLFIIMQLIYQNNLSSENLHNMNVVLVVGDKVNVRETPNINSKQLYQLRIASIITILKKSGIKQKIVNNIEGEWVYIDTEYTEPGKSKSIKGWVLDYYLAESVMFKKINSFIDCEMTGTIGDWHMNYHFYKNGIYNKINYDSESRKTNNQSGTIYKYRDVIIIKDDGEKPCYDFLYFNSNGYLCHYYRDNQGNSLCSKCKLPK